MEKETRLKYSLAIILGLFLIFNAAVVWRAASGHPLIGNQDVIPIGIKWLILFAMTFIAFGIAYWVHRAFLEAGVSPVATTWCDLVIIAYALLTMIALLFVSESWLLFTIFLLLLFFFSAFVLSKLLGSTKALVGWILTTILLTVLIVIFLSTLSPAS
jgi:hypothetical protein